MKLRAPTTAAPKTPYPITITILAAVWTRNTGQHAVHRPSSHSSEHAKSGTYPSSFFLFLPTSLVRSRGLSTLLEFVSFRQLDGRRGEHAIASA